MYKVKYIEFQDHVIEIKNFNYHHWISWPRNYTHEKFHKKFGRKTKIQGGWNNPPWLQTLVEIAWLYAG